MECKDRNSPEYFASGGSVLIETLWNVKDIKSQDQRIYIWY